MPHHEEKEEVVNAFCSVVACSMSERMATKEGKRGGVEEIEKVEKRGRNTDCMKINDPNANKNWSPVTLKTISNRRLKRCRKN